MDLQRSNSRGQIDDPGKMMAVQPLHQGVDSEAKVQIQNERTVLYQDVRVARPSVDNLWPVCPGLEFGEDRFVTRACAKRRNNCWYSGEGRQRFNFDFPRDLQVFRLNDCQPAETYGISGLQLSKFPEFRVHYHRRTNESAEARAIRSKHDGHIAGEIDRAHRVGIVMDIRWMQASFAAVGSSPIRLRPDQSDARSIGVIVNFPFGGKKRVDIFGLKKVGSSMRPVQDSELPSAGVIRND